MHARRAATGGGGRGRRFVKRALHVANVLLLLLTADLVLQQADVEAHHAATTVFDFMLEGAALLLVAEWLPVACDTVPQCANGNGLNSDSTGCEACPAGYSALNGNAPCAYCAAGKYQSETAATYDACRECPQGFQAHNEGSTQCAFCPKGFSFEDTSQPCASCSAGKYQDENALASAVCKFCSAGAYFQSTTAPCESCPTGWSQPSSNTAQAQCAECPSGKAFANAFSACQVCKRANANYPAGENILQHC